MTTKPCDDGILVTFSNALDNRTKVLFLCCFLGLFVYGSYYLGNLLMDGPDATVVVVILIALLVCYIAAYRFVNKAVMSERLFADKTKLQLISRGLFIAKKRTYRIDDISRFRHLEKPPPPQHPLAGQSMDYLGFQTQGVLISEMSGDKRVAFDYNGKTVVFGENIYSWDFEELIAALQGVTGLHLDFETEKRAGDGTEETGT